MSAREANSISMLGLAHVGDAVYELLIRSMLCQQGHSAVGDLHRSTVTLVRAEAQAQAMALLVDMLDEEELAVEVVCSRSPYELDDAALGELLSRTARPEVLLCANNHLALHCLQHIRRLGLKIPENVALLTFDNYPFSMLTDPTITAVEVDMHDMGVNAARFVLQRIRKPNLRTQSSGQ